MWRRCRQEKTDRKRHVVIDAEGSLLALATHAADVQDRAGAPAVIALACENFPSPEHLFYDRAYSGKALRDAVKAHVGPTIQVVKCPERVAGFTVIEHRRVVERTPHGWSGAGDWPRTGNEQSRHPKFGHSSLPNEDPQGSSNEKQLRSLNQTLRRALMPRHAKRTVTWTPWRLWTQTAARVAASEESERL